MILNTDCLIGLSSEKLILHPLNENQERMAITTKAGLSLGGLQLAIIYVRNWAPSCRDNLFWIYLRSAVFDRILDTSISCVAWCGFVVFHKRLQNCYQILIKRFSLLRTELAPNVYSSLNRYDVLLLVILTVTWVVYQCTPDNNGRLSSS